jgi:endonuclease/exonuclease/phosphatase family metal-dependent hydrolase
VRFGVAARIRRAADEVCRRKPDVALFQEVWLESYAKDILSHCEGAGYAPALPAQGGLSTGGLVMLYRTANWSSSRSAFTPFRSHASALRVWEGDGISRKGVLVSVLKDLKTAASVTVATTHLQSQYGSHHYSEVRASQVRELEAAIAAYRSSERPIILAGDFNTTPDEPLYSTLRERWIDLTADYRQRCRRQAHASCGTFFGGKSANEWIDYVFVGRADGSAATAVAQLIRNNKEDDPFSDHEGLQTDISITRSPAGARVFRQLLNHLSDPRLVTRRNSLAMLLGRSGITVTI